MKRSPEWLLLLAPFALIAGGALRYACGHESIFAWCLFTATAVICAGILVLAIIYVRYCRLEELVKETTYEENIPKLIRELIAEPAKLASDRPPGERVAFAKNRAKENQKRFHVKQQVIVKMARKSSGKDWLVLETADEVRAIAGEPWIFLRPDAIQTKNELVTLYWDDYKLRGQFEIKTLTDLRGILGNAMKPQT